MKPKELNNLIESLVYDEIRNKIVSEMLEGKKSVYHVILDGQPIDTFNSMEEAKEHVDKLKKDHPGKQFIIEKSEYESESDMIDKLDEMGEKLEEKENIDMKKNPKKFKSLAEAILYAKENNIKKIKVLNETYDVDETWKSMEEEETCDECGQMEEMDLINDDFGDDFDKLEDEPKPMKGDDKEKYKAYNDTMDGINSLFDDDDEKPNLPSKLKNVNLGGAFNKFKSMFKKSNNKDLSESLHRNLMELHPSHVEGDDFSDIECVKCSGMGTDEEGNDCRHCRGTGMERQEFSFDIDNEDDIEDDLYEDEGVCNECGSKLYEGVCNECGSLNESKKRILRLTESELIKTIENIVKEAKNDPFSKTVSKGQTIREPKSSSVPGMTVTKKAQSGSAKENKDYSNEVGKKMKDYLSFEGNDNPEFPKQVGKGEKMVVKTTDEENEYIEDNRGKGMQNLKYDHEPTERFKERVKKSLEGDSTMGNSQESGNSIKTDTGKKMVKQIKRSEEKKEKEPLYVKDSSPVGDYKPKRGHIAVNESKVLSEEIEKIKNIYSYNKKTQ